MAGRILERFFPGLRSVIFGLNAAQVDVKLTGGKPYTQIVRDGEATIVDGTDLVVRAIKASPATARTLVERDHESTQQGDSVTQSPLAKSLATLEHPGDKVEEIAFDRSLRRHGQFTEVGTVKVTHLGPDSPILAQP